MKEKLTPAEAACFDSLKKFIRIIGRPPSIGELAQELGISKSGAEKHLHSLRVKGAIVGPRIVGEWKPTALGEKMRLAIDN